MSKLLRTLQVTALVTLVAGCASSQTTGLPTAKSQAKAHADATQPPPTGLVAAPNRASAAPQTIDQAAPDGPSVQAGESDPGTTRYVKANGQLIDTVQAYAQEVAYTRNIPQPQVEAILQEARYDTNVARLMTPSKTRIRRSWVTYKNRFIEPVRIKNGVQFWRQHRKTLDDTAKAYGVPPSVIVAIIGVETVYGRYTGNFRVLDALATLGFSHPDTQRPERSQLFRDQLADLIQLDHQQRLNALLVQGSFAGAMGLPQFMPGSLLRYAADGDQDGEIDLLGSPSDAIVSVASFLRLHGWTPGLPIFAPVDLPAKAAALVDGGLNPTTDWATLASKGAKIRPGATNLVWQSYGLGVVDLLDEPRKLAEYRTGTPNFFAITHYNRSYFYATSVADLAQVLADQMGYGGPN